MSCRRSLAALVALGLSLPTGAAAQTAIRADRIGLGGSAPTTTSAIVVDPADIPANTAGQNLLFLDGSGNARKGTLAKGDLPSAVGYLDEAETWALLQTFTSGYTSNGASTINNTLGVTGLGTFSGGITTTTGTMNTLASAGDLTLAAAGGDILPNTNIGQTLGSPSAMLNSIYAREIRALTLVAQDVVSTIGGWLYVGATTKLLAPVLAASGRIVVEHNEAAVNDRLYLSARLQAEIMVVTAGPVACSGSPASCGGISTGYYYDVTRGDASTGADDWLAGDAVMNTGVIGDCFIEQYAFTSLGSGSAVGPTIVGNCRTANAGYSWGPRWAIGQLNGLYGVATSTFGAAFGDPADVNTLITATYWKLRDGTTDKFSLDGATGNMSITGALSVGTSGSISSGATGYASGTGYWLDYNSGTPRFYIGNGTSSTSEYLTWSGSAMTVAGALIARGGLTVQTNTGGGAAITTNTLSDLRIQNSTVLGTITLLASGGLNVDKGGGTSGSGFTGTKTVRASGGASDCTLVYIIGILTGGTC